MGLTLLDEVPNDPMTSSVAWINAEYNTGWMNGDIKLATLSDTDDTDVTGTSLAANGTFSSDTSWTKGEQWTISGGSASITDSPDRTSDSYLEQNISGLVAGKQYVIRITYSGSIGDIDAYLGGNRVFSLRTNYGNSADLYLNLTAGSSNTKFAVVANQHFVGSVDNFELYEAAQDRSVNGNGLQVFGSITKNPVNSGADLVAYSGFSASNYLQQPHNSDLEFGTGDYSFICWVYGGDTSVDYAWVRGGPNGGSPDKIIGLRTNTAGWEYITYNAAVGTIVVSGPSVVNNWRQIVCTRESGIMKMYVDGVLQSDTENQTSNMDGGTDHILRIGTNTWNATNPFAGSIALFRASATAPSPEQIAKIYEDEKVLFQDGAQATLYGSSDAVTALAYDDSTELLHVGTSAGRSVFQGLRRVDNTTTAVSAAISASNNLVGEQ